MGDGESSCNSIAIFIHFKQANSHRRCSTFRWASECARERDEETKHTHSRSGSRVLRVEKREENPLLAWLCVCEVPESNTTSEKK